MILTLAEQFQRLSHKIMCTLKILGVFKEIGIHDLCDDGAVLFPTEPWSHSDVSKEQMSSTNWPLHIWVGSLLRWLEHCTCIAEVMGSNPVEDTWYFWGAHIRKSLRLSRKCEDHFLNSSLNHNSQTFLSILIELEISVSIGWTLYQCQCFLSEVSKQIYFYINRFRRISCSSQALNCYVKRYSKLSPSTASWKDGADIIFDKFLDDAVDRRKLEIKF